MAQIGLVELQSLAALISVGFCIMSAVNAACKPDSYPKEAASLGGRIGFVSGTIYILFAHILSPILTAIALLAIYTCVCSLLSWIAYRVVRISLSR